MNYSHRHLVNPVQSSKSGDDGSDTLDPNVRGGALTSAECVVLCGDYASVFYPAYTRTAILQASQSNGQAFEAERTPSLPPQVPRHVIINRLHPVAQ